MNEYQKTNLTKILEPLNIKENNFISIFEIYDEMVKENKLNNFSEENILRDENDLNLSPKIKENLIPPDSNSLSKQIEILDNGSVKIKNDKNINDTINNKNILNFDDEEEFIMSYGNNKAKNEILNNNFNYQDKNTNNIKISDLNNIIFNNDSNNSPGKKIKLISKNEDKNYQKTYISNIFENNNIFNIKKFQEMIIYTKKKLLTVKNSEDFDESKVKVNLNSNYKNKYNNLFEIINEEDNESNDSMSLQKSARSSARKTPKIYNIKKLSVNDLEEIKENTINDSDINTNLLKSFSKEKADLMLNIDNNIMIKEMNMDQEDEDKSNDNTNNFSSNNKEKRIMSIDIDLRTDKINDINYTTPETKGKTIEKIYENVNDTNDEKNKNYGPKEFSGLENDDLQFSDFNPNLNDNDKNNIHEINIINNKSDENIYSSELNIQIKNGDNIKNENLSYIKFNNNIFDDKDKNMNKIYGKISYNSYFRIMQLASEIKLNENQIFYKFIKKLFNKLPKDIEKNSISNNKVINNNKIPEDINLFENGLNLLFKMNYLYLSAKNGKLLSNNGQKKLIEEIHIYINKKQEEIEQLLNNLLSQINNEGKENYYLYIKKIQNILRKYLNIQKKKIIEQKISNKRDKFKPPKYKENTNLNTKQNEKENLFINIFSIIILFFIFIFIFIYNYYKND